MHNPVRIIAHRFHHAQLGVLVWLGGVLIHQAHILLRNLHVGSGLGAWGSLTWWQVSYSGLDYIFFGGMLVVLGIILVYKADAHSAQERGEPLLDILQCVKAAAAGDTSRIPENRSNDEVGELSQAVGGLITVLARSENLVYHQAALIESSGEAIISCSLDGTILSWNKGAQRIYGYPAEMAKGRPLTLLSPGDQGTEMRQQLERIRNGEQIQPFEALHQASNGRTVKALVRLSAVLDSTRQAIGVSFCAQDMTDVSLTRTKSIESPRIS